MRDEEKERERERKRERERERKRESIAGSDTPNCCSQSNRKKIFAIRDFHLQVTTIVSNRAGEFETYRQEVSETIDFNQGPWFGLTQPVFYNVLVSLLYSVNIASHII